MKLLNKIFFHKIILNSYKSIHLLTVLVLSYSHSLIHLFYNASSMVILFKGSF